MIVLLAERCFPPSLRLPVTGYPDPSPFAGLRPIAVRPAFAAARAGDPLTGRPNVLASDEHPVARSPDPGGIGDGGANLLAQRRRRRWCPIRRLLRQARSDDPRRHDGCEKQTANKGCRAV